MSGALRQFTARKPAAGGFSPDDIAGLVLWFDADAITGLADGDPVAQWDDLSGNTRHATQGTPANRPTYKTGIQNGNPTIRFVTADATSLETAAFTAVTQPTTVFLVGEFRDGNNRGYFFDGQDLDNRYAFARGLDADNDRFGTFAGGVSDSMNGAVVALPTGVDYWTAAFNGSSSTLRRNGTLYSSGNPGPDPLSQMRIGRSIYSGGYMTGDIFEIVAYDSLLGTSDRDDVETYLATKWGITL